MLRRCCSGRGREVGLEEVCIGVGCGAGGGGVVVLMFDARTRTGRLWVLVDSCERLGLVGCALGGRERGQIGLAGCHLGEGSE